MILKPHRLQFVALAGVVALATLGGAYQEPVRSSKPTDLKAAPVVVRHKTFKVGDLDIFYREAGPKDAPAILLLHGFPTSSQMYRNLIPALADKYRVVAPDYPGFGPMPLGSPPAAGAPFALGPK